jgi:two-component system, NarL family, response regulator
MKKRTILLIDDHLMFRLGIRSVLAKQPTLHVVAEAKNYQEAVDAFAKFKPDLAILDLRLPGRSGIEILGAILAAEADARVLVLSSFANEEEVYRAMKAGAKGYLLKDADSDELLSVVDKVLQGGQHVPPSLRSMIAGRAATPDLTPRETEVLGLMVKGLTNKEIAAIIGASQNTVRNHTIKVFEKLEVADRAEATSAALQRGIIIPES